MPAVPWLRESFGEIGRKAVSALVRADDDGQLRFSAFIALESLLARARDRFGRDDRGRAASPPLAVWSAAGEAEVKPAAGELPAIVVKAQEDLRTRAALARMGYRNVRAAYAQELRAATPSDLFSALDAEDLWPTMEFVADWLKAEKRRIAARTRWTFLCALLATLVAGIGFIAGLAILK
jgi:hypothetical protein